MGFRRIAKNKKSVARAYGGSRCAVCVRERSIISQSFHLQSVIASLTVLSAEEYRIRGMHVVGCTELGYTRWYVHSVFDDLSVILYPALICCCMPVVCHEHVPTVIYLLLSCHDEGIRVCFQVACRTDHVH